MAIVVTYSAPDITVTGGTSGTPATWHDIYLADVAGGWGVVAEIVANRLYTCAANVRYGDGSTATYAASENEIVYFGNGFAFVVKSAAILRLGKSVGVYGTHGSYWSVAPTGDGFGHWPLIETGATTAQFLLYASVLHNRADVWIRIKGGIASCILSQFHGEWDIDNDWLRRISFEAGTMTFRDMKFVNINLFQLNVVPAEMAGVHVHHSADAIQVQAAVIATGLLATTAWWDNYIYGNGASQLTARDPVSPLLTVAADNPGVNDWTAMEYTCNVHIADAAGANLAGVNIVCNDKNGTQSFSVNTAANGSITPQNILYKKWLSTDPTNPTTYSPHSFIFTFPSGRVVTYEAITVDHPIVWHIEEPQSVIVLED